MKAADFLKYGVILIGLYIAYRFASNALGGFIGSGGGDSYNGSIPFNPNGYVSPSPYSALPWAPSYPRSYRNVSVADYGSGPDRAAGQRGGGQQWWQDLNVGYSTDGSGVNVSF